MLNQKTEGREGEGVPEEALSRGEARGVRAVVVSYNTRELTLRCVRALRDSRLEDLTVCVVDNASEDGSVQALHALSPAVEVMALPHNIGFGAANNRGVGRSRASFVALINSDAFVSEDTLATLRSYLQGHPRVGIVGPRLLNADGSPQPCWFPFPSPARAWRENLGLVWALGCVRRLFGLRNGVVSGPVDWVSGACLMVRREVWMASCGFDEQFFLYAEESDWQRRVRDLGWEIHGVAEASATHVGGASGAAFSATTQAFFWEGVDRYFRAHFGAGGLLALRAATAVGAALRGMGCLLGLDWKKACRWGGILRRQCTHPFPRGARRWSSLFAEAGLNQRR